MFVLQWYISAISVEVF